ncbi:MAG: TonB-dependent receptor [Crocinitomicaceae bacterium]|nr:TonB-dependent receptor [Crocinitomicaceae bacterium]|tara:strand:- start:1714 stop:4299 length:2586 start_codon:yes stop_codon:yes gene_type:complete
MKRHGLFASIFLLAFLFSFTTIKAQLPPPEFHFVTISGIVSNQQGEPLPGATIQVFVSTGSNNKLHEIDAFPPNNEGIFQKSYNEGNYLLVTRFLGYETDTLSLTLTQNNDRVVNIRLKVKAVSFDEVVVSATRASETTPIPHQEIKEDELNKLNNGVDLPILLDQATSVVTTSDAGAGVGYTGLRIRGTDPTRINITINGIPVNDAESQGTFWVNMPDFASSVSSVQIQRGVGTSTNGAAAFGATVNLNTFNTQKDAYGIYSGAIGSFNTVKHTAEFGTGLIDGQYYVDGRLSQITSDGYIDRAASDLKSYYLSAGRITSKSHLKFITFGGKERTYQAWYGVPQSKIDAGERTYNPYDYDDQVDDYGQTHYQLHYLRTLGENFKLTTAAHYTKGAGYYEEYKGDRYMQDIFNSPQSFSDYGLADVMIGNDTISETNLIRRRWLDNDFYGGIFSLQYNKKKLNATLGGGFNYYEGEHYGEIIWAEYASDSYEGYRWYNGKSEKYDYNVYGRVEFSATEKINLFADLQYRHVDYSTKGVDNDLSSYDVNANLDFFNPKAGIFIKVSDQDNIYGSFSVGNREPSRNDYIDRAQGVDMPEPETLYDYELGYQRSTKKYMAGINFYYMDYYNQLVLTGEVNDVGSAIRQNVANSYRAGIEIEAAYQPVKWFNWAANATFSQNKIEKYTEQIYSWDTYTYPDALSIEYENTDISFSPNIIAANTFEFTTKGFVRNPKTIEDQVQLALISKYVGDQYLDNSQSDLRKLDAYFVNDIRLTYTLKNTFAKEIGLNLIVRNILSEEYASNGWSYRFRHPDQSWGTASSYDIYAERDTEVSTGDADDVAYNEVAYYTQAKINFMLGLTVKF